MEKIEYRYRFWYRYRPKFMVSDWYRIETKKAGIAHHYRISVVNLIGLWDKIFFNLSFDWLVLITLYIVVDIFIVITTIIRLLLSLCEI